MSRIDACLDLMGRNGIDVMLLGREANARTVVDASRLWLAGTRVFSPACVVVRRSRAVHLLANTDAVAPGLPVDRLYGLTWNSETLIAALRAIDGVSNARRVAVDGMSPMARGIVAQIAPEAELVDAGALFAALWAIPDPEKTTGVPRAAVVARAGLEAMISRLHPGATARQLRGLCAEAFASHGVTTPAFEAVAAALGPGASTWLPPERPLEEDERVVLRSGALCEGWEASLARTYTVARRPVPQPDPSAWSEMLAACTAGTAVGDLRARGIVYGAGRGIEAWSDDFALAPGLMAAIECRDGDTLRQDVVRITEREPVIVTAA